MKAIVEDALKRGIRRELVLYWGARTRSGLYAEALARKWPLKFVPVLSEEAWAGRRGLVHAAVLEDFSSLAGHEVYACGAPAMIDAARREFVAERALAPHAFYADPFTPRD
jgi:CDP-4-dehydro-6-deoxyglucose reductase